jgi:hypothetical protein
VRSVVALVLDVFETVVGVVGIVWLAVTPASRLGGPWSACALMLCACWAARDGGERLRQELSKGR